MILFTYYLDTTDSNSFLVIFVSNSTTIVTVTYLTLKIPNLMFKKFQVSFTFDS